MSKNKDLEEEDETNILLDILSFFCNFEIKSNTEILTSRFLQLLRQVFSSDSIQQLCTPRTALHLISYPNGEQPHASLSALIPALGMIFRNLRHNISEHVLLEAQLRRLRQVLGERTKIIFQYLCASRYVVKSEEIQPGTTENNWQQTGCYYSKALLRHRPYYEGRDTNKVGDEKEEGTCTKLYTTYGKKKLTGGIMALWCTHSHCLGFHKIPKAEGRNDVFSAIFKYWEKAPEVIIYDCACQLGPYCMAREPIFFKNNTLFAVDEMHAARHVKCS